MTDNTQPEAREFTMIQYASKDDMIGAMRKRIAELESELEAVGAGGVSGPLMGQPQAMPDLSALTERGAKAWAGVDAQALRDGTYQQAAPKAAPVVWLSSKQLRGVTALHGQYLPFRCQPEGRFDTPVYLVEAAPKAAPARQVGTIAHIGNGRTTLTAAIASVLAAPKQEAHHLTQALTDPENQPNQYGVEFGMSGQQMHFKIGNQMFRLAYEPDDQEEFEFMKRMLVNAFSTFTPDVKTAPQQEAQEPAVPPCISDAYERIDRFLRNNLGDEDYADFSHDLELLCTAQPTPQPAPDCHHRPPCDECAHDIKTKEAGNAN